MEYKVSTAVRTGRQHESRGLPCQDRTAVWREDGTVCAALADGAGSRRDSQVGADCVTSHIARLLCREFDGLWEMPEGALARYLTDSCVQALAEQDPPLYELACTLLFFAGQRDGRFLSGHLGDGVALRVTEGSTEVFSPPENGVYQNETYFITAEDAADHLRLRRGTLPPAGAVLLMSDGMAESLYQRTTGAPASACKRMAQWLLEGEEETVSQALADNMEHIFSQRSGDDLSLVVLAWNEAEEGEEDDG